MGRRTTEDFFSSSVSAVGLFLLIDGVLLSIVFILSLTSIIIQLDSSIVGVVLLTVGFSTLHLPPEIVVHIWSLLTLKDLVKFSQTSQSNRWLVHSTLKNTIFQLILPFTPKEGVDAFLSMMMSKCVKSPILLGQS